MNKVKLHTHIIFMIVFITMVLGGCSSVPAGEQQTVATVQHGNLEIKADADGYIETPASINLYFDTTMFSPPYSGKIRKIYVEKGDVVKEGALLAKLDDTAQKLNVEASQYALELAINNVVQTVCCGVARSPGFYCDAVAFKRFEFAQNEMHKAQVYLLDGKYDQSSEQITLARLDLEGARDFYSDPSYHKIRPDLTDMIQTGTEDDIYIDEAVARLNAEIDQLIELQNLYKEGAYTAVRETLQYILIEMTDTYSVVKRLNHFPGAVNYPDTCTTYTVISEVLSSLDKLEALSQQKEIDNIKYAETLSIARHDLELSKKIIDENISTFRQGLNLKALRDYNINIQTAIINLERSKQALLKTELIAPFDGRVEDINLREGELIAQRYAVTGAPIDSYIIRLANISYIKMVGTVDEIDAVKIKAGQKARVFVDAAPGQQFDGIVKFISTYGPQKASGIQYYGTAQPTVGTYEVEIGMDKDQTAGLYGGLTASAEILIDSRADVLIVPKGAVSGKSGNYTVRVLEDEKTGIIEQRPVKIGVQTRSQTEILSGLQEGEMVLLDKIAAPARPLNINNIKK
ncbi:MAG: efflux RND transporter periplasmic adaptor subunit [Dehalococcoidia bacterium]|nr:efflux RND transporter periplasmic adaptor subunit [Dehalococcoidia bacterium]